MNGNTKFAGVLAVLTLLLASQSLPVIQFLVGELKVFAALPLFAPIVIAAIVGAIAPAWLPHMLPASWPPHRTKRVTRLLACGIAFVMVIWRYPSAIGFQYGLFAASMAYVVWTMLSGYVYRKMPHLTPPSLEPAEAPDD